MTNPTIQVEVAEKIAKSGKHVRDIVVDKLSQVEIDKRIELVVKAIKLQETIESELKKLMKPDDVRYDEHDKPIEFTSKAQREKRMKTKERFDNLIKATDTALDKNDEESFKKLKENYEKANQQGGEDKGNKQKPEAESTD